MEIATISIVICGISIIVNICLMVIVGIQHISIKDNTNKLGDTYRKNCELQNSLKDTENELSNTKELLSNTEEEMLNSEIKLEEAQTKLSGYANVLVSNNVEQDIQHMIELDIPRYLFKIKHLDKELDRLKLLVEQYKKTMREGTFDITYIKDEELYTTLYNLAIDDNISQAFNSTIYKDLIKEQRDKEKLLVKDGSACKGTTWNLPDKKLTKAMIFVFDTFCDKQNMLIKYNNLATCEKRIISAFDKINKLFSHYNVHITTEYLNSKLLELKIEHLYQEDKQKEKEERQELYKQIREEKKRQKEIELQQQALEKQLEEKAKQEQQKREMEQQINQIRQSLEIQSKIKIDNELAIQNIEQEKLRLKLRDLEEQLRQAQSISESESDIEEKIVDLEKEKEILQSGFVYIISNTGAFGKDIFKIGVTRRDDPMDRVKELSGASVPFKFSTHAIIPSSQAFRLEHSIHKRLKEYRVNLVNNRKEFFRIDTNDLIDILKEVVGNIDFVRDIEDEQYTQSLEIRNNKDKYEQWLIDQEEYFDDEETTEIETTYRVIDEYTSILDDMKLLYKNVDLKVTKYYVAYYIDNYKVSTFYKSGNGKHFISFSIEGYTGEETNGTRNSIKIQQYYDNKDKYLKLMYKEV